MVEYSKINCKLTNVQLNKFKKAVKSNEGATLRLSIKNFNKDETPHELLLTTRQSTKLCNAINNNSGIDIKLSKAQIKKLIQSGGFLSKLLSKLAGPLMKVGMPLAKNLLAALGLTAAMSAIDGSIQKKIHGSGIKLIIEEEDMQDIIKIIKKLENSDILLKGVSKTIENEIKEQRGGFLSMLLETLGASLLGNLLTGKGIMRAGDGIVRAGDGSKKNPLNSLLPFDPLTNIEISEYYKNEPRFNGVYSRNNLPNKIKNGAYVINLDEYKNTCTHWVSLFVKTNEVIYFNSFGVEHIPKEINKFIGNNKKIKANIFRIQAYDSIMCGYFCIEFINYMLKGKTLLDYTSLFSPNDFKKNGQIIKTIFKNE